MNVNKTPMFDGQQSVTTDRNRVLLALFPETVEVAVMEERDSAEETEEIQTREETVAWQVWVGKPLTRAAAINACEQEAYGLRSAMDVASFGASLARKARLGEDTAEVEEHDSFIKQVKAELTRIGVK